MQTSGWGLLLNNSDALGKMSVCSNRCKSTVWFFVFLKKAETFFNLLHCFSQSPFKVLGHKPEYQLVNLYVGGAFDFVFGLSSLRPCFISQYLLCIQMETRMLYYKS